MTDCPAMERAGGTDVDDLLASADRLMAGDRWGEAVDLLTDANRREADPRIEVRLVTARHRKFAAPASAPEGEWPPTVPDRFPGTDGIPEIGAADLDGAALTSALQHHGSLIVRGLLARSVAETLATEVQRAFDAAEAFAAGAPVAETSPWYVPFEPAEGYDFGAVERQFFRFGAVLAVESPRALFLVIEALRAAGLDRVIAEHLGEAPALSAKKTSLRRARPDAATEWHQDGAFLGDGTRTVNTWTALSPCGIDAPSVDVFARPFDDLVVTETGDARYDWSVGVKQAEALESDDIVRPVFEPGDAIMFNQLTLHRTGVSPSMTEDRYALESWFFAPSTYPYPQVPIAF